MPEVAHLAAVVSAETAQFHRELRGVIRKMQRTDKQAKDSGKAIKDAFLGIAGAVSAGLAVKALVDFGNASIDLAAATEASLKRVESVVRATGQAAGLSARQINDFATEMQQSTVFSADQINDISAALLTFKTIQGDTFKRTIAAAADLSTVLGTDLKSSVLQLGKALEDPATGLTALRRSGVSFTAEQKNLIKTLQDTNQLAKAQSIILGAVEGQVGGTAKDAIKTYAGATEQLGNAWEEVRKAMVEGWVGSLSVNDFLVNLTKTFRGLSVAMQEGRADALNESLSILSARAGRIRGQLEEAESSVMSLFSGSRANTLHTQLEETERQFSFVFAQASKGFDNISDDFIGITADADAATKSVKSFVDTATVGPNFSRLFDSAAWQELGFRQAQAEARGREAGQAAAAGLTAAVDWVDPVQNAAGWARLGEAQAKAEWEARARVQEQLAMVPSDVLWVDPKENAAAFQDLTAEFQVAQARGASTAIFIGQRFADAFAQATFAGESFGDAMSEMLKQLAQQVVSSGIAGLIGAGIGFFFAGPAGAKAGFQLGSGVSLHSGGIVGGGSSISPRLASDEVPIIAQRGEMIVNKDDTRDMLAGKADQSAGPVVLQINGREFGRLVGDMTRSGRVALQ